MRETMLSINHLKQENLLVEVITLTREKRNKSELNQEELGAELSPDDLDLREDNELTKEQMKNSQTKKQHKKHNAKKQS